MKKMKKALAIVLAGAMTLGMATTAMAQSVGTAADNTATITISNAAKGETYTIYKLFDATVTGTEEGSIAYTGDIPTSLNDYFQKDTAGNISLKDGITMDANLQDALKEWTGETGVAAEASAVSDGTVLDFVGLDYGYYVVISTQGNGSSITVDSTNPNVTIVDKNSTTPSAGEKFKTVNDTDINIGDTLTYTVEFSTSNYDGAGTAAKKIVSYTIKDTLPEFLKDVEVTSIIVDNDGNKDTTSDQVDVTAQFVNKAITLEWYDDTAEQFKYDNGATVTVTYTAVVDDDATIDGDGNKNEVSISWTLDDKTTKEDQLKSDVTVYTYAIALKKVSDEGAALAGATFEFPFYVKETKATDGSYIYAGTSAGVGLTNTIITPDNGEIVVKGVETGKYSITETAAPSGYNMLTAPVEVEATALNAEKTTVTQYIDEKGNVTNIETEKKVTYTNDNFAASVVIVVNKTGATLPSTGGMGTTIFYVLGSIMVLGAGVLLVTKKRMSINE